MKGYLLKIGEEFNNCCPKVQMDFKALMNDDKKGKRPLPILESLGAHSAWITRLEWMD